MDKVFSALSMFLILLILASYIPLSEAHLGGISSPKLIVRVYLTYFWINGNADVDDVARGDSDLWLISIIKQYTHDTSPFVVGEKTVDEDDLDANGNYVYDKGDKRMRVLGLAGPLDSDKGPKKIVYTDVAYFHTQCEPLRPLDVYVHLVDSDNDDSDEYKFATKLVVKLFNTIFNFSGPFNTLVGEAISGVFSIFGSGGYDSAGVGSVNSWHPSLAYPVLRGNPKPGQMWNLGNPKQWKRGDIPPKGQTWVSDEGKVELKLNGKLSAIVWFRVSVYNTGIPCKETCKVIPKEKTEKTTGIKEAAVTKLPDSRKLGFKVKFNGNITTELVNLSLVASSMKVAKTSSITGGVLKKAQEGITSLGEHNDTIFGSLDLTGLDGIVNLSIISLNASARINEINVSLEVSKPQLGIVANKVDLDLFQGELPQIEAKGFSYSIYTPDELEYLSEVPVVLILGGPDAYQDVGDLVRSLLPEDKQQEMRDQSASFLLPNALSREGINQTVILVGGKDRYQTLEKVRDIMPFILEELSSKDSEPPQMVGCESIVASSISPHGIVAEVPYQAGGTDIAIYWNEPISEVSLGVSAKYNGETVPLPESIASIRVNGPVTTISLEEGVPKDLLLDLVNVRDTRGNILERPIQLELKLVGGEKYPYMILDVIGNESMGNTFFYYVRVRNLGDRSGSVYYELTQAPPPFINVEVEPETSTIPPGGLATFDISVAVGEEAVPGTYPFQVTFHLDSYEGTISHPLNLTVRVWMEG
ncbi:MAG: hypothetical protein DRN78_00790 [Thermoproteota archaeon]|nr:MAG: hypothetical protein DRN78_00790 [Candidatus Korarchaeota archaeon]